MLAAAGARAGGRTGSRSRVTRQIFVTQRLTKVYQTGEVKVFALNGVDLTLYESEMTVLLGASGSGKSTLLNILGGLDHATSGRVMFRDEELTAMNDRQLTRYRRDHVGFVFQFYDLVPAACAPRRQPGQMTALRQSHFRRRRRPCRAGAVHR